MSRRLPESNWVSVALQATAVPSGSGAAEEGEGVEPIHCYPPARATGNQKARNANGGRQKNSSSRSPNRPRNGPRFEAEQDSNRPRKVKESNPLP